MKLLNYLAKIIAYHLSIWIVAALLFVVCNLAMIVWHLDFKHCGKPGKWCRFDNGFYDRIFN